MKPQATCRSWAGVVRCQERPEPGEPRCTFHRRKAEEGAALEKFERLMDVLEGAAREVASWPKWKRDLWEQARRGREPPGDRPLKLTQKGEMEWERPRKLP